MVLDARGAWLYHLAFVSHWNSGPLPDVFAAAGALPFHLFDTNWEEPTFGAGGGVDAAVPFVVYSIGQATIHHHSTANKEHDRLSEMQVVSVPVKIDVRVWHEEGSGTVSAKSLAVSLAGHVAERYDDAQLDFTPDKLVCTMKGPDYGFREVVKEKLGKEIYVRLYYHWVLEYTWLVEAALNRFVQQF